MQESNESSKSTGWLTFQGEFIEAADAVIKRYTEGRAMDLSDPLDPLYEALSLSAKGHTRQTRHLANEIIGAIAHGVPIPSNTLRDFEALKRHHREGVSPPEA